MHRYQLSLLDSIKYNERIRNLYFEGEKNNTPYTNKDKFKKMLSDNPNLEKLRVKLGLDPDY